MVTTSTPRRRALAAAMISALAGALLIPAFAAAPAFAEPGQCPPGYLPGPDTPDGNEIWTDDNVAVYAGGDFLADEAAAESEGLLVVEGDATFDKAPGGRFNVGWVGVGSQVAPTPGSTMLAVGGALAVGDATVLDIGAGATDETGTLLGGDVLVGGGATPQYPAPQYDLNNGSLQTGMGAAALADYATFGASVAANSAAYAVQLDTGPATVAGAAITFLGNDHVDGSIEVFTVEASLLDSITEVNFADIADDSPVVINVVGADAVTFSPNYFSDDGVRADDLTSALFGLVAQRTMWNFVETTSVTFGGSSQFLGSVMAPNADFDITASMNGRVYADGDIHMHGVGNELHNYPWIYDFECVPEPTDPTGSVEITKELGSTGVVAADRRFLGWIECTGADVDGTVYQEGEIRAGETVTVTGLPIGATCVVKEDPDAALDAQEALPPGFIWAEPVWTVDGEVVDEAVFEVVDPTAPVQVAITATNTLLGTFEVTKVVDDPDAVYTGERSFEVAYSCDADAYGPDGTPLGAGSGEGVFLVAAGQTAASDWFPVGTTCIVSEETPAAQTGDFDGSYAWTTPTIEPATAVVGAGDASPVAVTVTNTYAAQTGAFTVAKVFDAGASGYTGDFSIAWDCGAAGAGTVAVAAGEISDPVVVPLGATCAVSEPELPVVPAGWEWGEPTVTPASFTVADGATAVEVTVTNTITPAAASGWFSIIKVVRNPDAIIDYDNSFTGAVICSAGEWSAEFGWALTGGQTSGLYEVPLGATCTVSEDDPADPQGASWSAPVITPASFTVDADDPVAAVTVSNTLRGTLPATGGTIALSMLALGTALVATGLAAFTVSRRREL